MSNLSQIFPEKKERTDFWIAIAVILLFLAAIIYYIFGPEKLNEIPGVATVNEVVEEGADFTFETSEDTVLQAYDAKKGNEKELDALVESVEKDSVSTGNNAVSTDEDEISEIENVNKEEEKEEELPVYVDEDDPAQPVEEIDTSLNETSTAGEEVSSEVTSTDEEPAEEVKEPETPAVVPPVVEDKKDEIEKNNRFELETDSDDSPYGCIIILGSFKEPNNAKLLAETLEKENHPVYEGAYKGYYVVGVNADCARATVVPLRNKLRTKYEKSAWIYKR